MKPLLIAIAFCLSLAGAARAGGAPDLVIEGSWARATPAGSPNSAAYFTLRNTGKTADTLESAQSDAAATTELHESVMAGTMMQMKPLGALDIPAGSTVEFKPGGKHVMLMGLKAPLKAGDHFTLTLRFKSAGPRAVSVEVRDIGAPGQGTMPMH